MLELALDVDDEGVRKFLAECAAGLVRQSIKECGLLWPDDSERISDWSIVFRFTPPTATPDAGHAVHMFHSDANRRDNLGRAVAIGLWRSGQCLNASFDHLGYDIDFIGHVGFSPS